MLFEHKNARLDRKRKQSGKHTDEMSKSHGKNYRSL